jgi:predicted nucleic acid-binding protein
VNRGDRHHRWAVEEILAARKNRRRLVVPSAVAGEAFTKLRYDRRVSPRRDASVALTVFGLLSERGLFEVRASDLDQHQRATELLARYKDQSFSYVDALCFVAVDDDRDITRVLTVDRNDFAAYRFGHRVEVAGPD